MSKIKDTLSFSSYSVSKLKRPSFEVLVARSSDMNRRSSSLKILGQKRMVPSADNATLVNSESQLYERYEEFASGKINIVKILVGLSVYNLYTSRGTLSSFASEILENLKYLIEVSNESR